MAGTVDVRGGELGVEPQDQVDEADLAKPSAARMYDYYLGGSHNFASDREAAGKALELFPDGPIIARANRAFLHRSVRFFLAHGVRQFLDLGSGIPTAGNVHEIAPEAKVVYVDTDPVAVAYSQMILNGSERAAIVHADLRHPREVLDSPVTRGLLDFNQPIGLLMIAVLHFVDDAADPAGAVAAFREALPLGSGLAVAHMTVDGHAEKMTRLAEIYRHTANPIHFRTRAQIAALLTGWELVEPGLDWVAAWRPDWPEHLDDDPSWCANYGAVGWKV